MEEEGLEPSKLSRLIYSQIPLPLGDSSNVMCKVGVEPTRPRGHRILSYVSLKILALVNSIHVLVNTGNKRDQYSLYSEPIVL